MSTNTISQLKPAASSCVATIGASARPSSEMKHCCRPWFSPRRLGLEATATAANDVGV
jgi:hypothetical protein